MRTMIDIDERLFREIQRMAERHGQPASLLIEHALRESLKSMQRPVESTEVYGEPLTDEDIAESAQVTFRSLDREEAGGA